MVDRFKSFVNSKNSVRSASVILVITLTLSNVLGLLRDRFLATYIPTSELDIYFAAFRIPDLIFNFLILGAISSAFIPVFCDLKANGKKEDSWDLTNSLMNIGVVILAVLAVLFYFLMPYLTKLVVPSFDAERMVKTVELSRLLILTPIFFSISYFLSGILNSYNRFVAYSIAPLIYNLSIIAGAVIVGPSIGIKGVIYFVILGSILHFAVQLPTAKKLGYNYRLLLDFTNKNVRKVVKLMIPRTIGLGMNQIMLLVYTALASALVSGSITAFNFANNIQTMPTVVFGTSFATAVFPTLTTAIAEKRYDRYTFYLGRSIRSIAFFLIPLSLLFIMLRAQIVRLILGSGHFAWDDTRMTAMALGYFSISLLFQGLIPILARSFYAMKNTTTPMIISILTVVISVAFGYPLASSMGVAGLALAFSIGSFFNAVALYFMLAKKHKEVLDRKVLYSLTKITSIAGFSASIAWFSMHYFASFLNLNTFFGVLWQALLTTAVGATIYIILAYLFNFEEITWAISRKITKK